MKQRTLIVAAAAALLASSTVACGALLGFPDETNADPSFGKTDGGGGPDVTLPDGGALDSSTSPDSPFPLDAPIVSPDGGCNCFGGTCDGGVCQPVAIVVGTTDPNFIDTDDTTVFFASGANIILAVDPNDVDAGVRAITNTEASVNALQARSGYVYFTNANSGNLNSVSRCSGAAGCAGDRTEYGVSSRSNFGVAVDGANVYFTVKNTQGAKGGGIWKRSQTGDAGATLLLGRDYPGFIATNGTSVAWAEGASNIGLVQCSTAGGSLVAGGEQAIVDLAYGANSNAYFVKSSSLWRQSGTQPVQIGGGPQVVNAVAVRADASYVYWLNGGSSGALMRCPEGIDCLVQPGQVVTLASGLQRPFGLALGNDSIYFTTRDDNKVWRLRK